MLAANPFGPAGLPFLSLHDERMPGAAAPWERVRDFAVAECAAATPVDALVFRWRCIRRRWYVHRCLTISSADDAAMVMRELFRTITVVLRVDVRSPGLATLLRSYSMTTDGLLVGPSDPQHFSDPLPWPESFTLRGPSDAYLLLFHDADRVVLVAADPELMRAAAEPDRVAKPA